MITILLAVKLAVSLPQPSKRRSTLCGKTVMEVHERVVVLHILVQSVSQIAGTCNIAVMDMQALIRSWIITQTALLARLAELIV